MPSRSLTLPDGVHRLSKLVTYLTASPKPTLHGVKNIRVCLASKNDHFGARKFVREELPRIRYANPAMGIEVKRAESTREAPFRATMDVELADGTKKELSLQSKETSSAILKELMDVASGRHKAAANGLPATGKATTSAPTSKLPTLDEWQKIQKALKKANKAQAKVEVEPKKGAPGTNTKGTKTKEATAKQTSTKANKVKETDTKGTKVKASNAKDTPSKPAPISRSP